MTSRTDRTRFALTFDSDAKPSQLEKIREIINHRYLLRNLVVRDLKARYKNSIFGVFWNLLNPLLMMTVYTLLFTRLLAGNSIPNFALFILIGLVPWQFLTGTLSGGVNAVIANASLVNKVYFPRILLPISALLSNFINFLFAASLVLGMLYIYGIGLTIHALWVPAILFTQLVFMLGLAMLISALNTFYRDVGMILDVVMLAWFFLTPIFYPFEQFAEYATVAGLTFDVARVMRWVNPMASIIDGYRTVLWGNASGVGPGSMDPLNLLRTLFTSMIIFVIGYVVFNRTQHLFGERL
ncbi:MAG: ABC transporter permease [Chloroflexi bacterium]|nr:MAG: ABC transporter permease [Chloroflexota bacterium]